MKTALLSVSNKEGIVDFAKKLSDRGFRIISSGGTQRELAASGVKVLAVSDLTGFPECLDGRVKTLHPAIHAGILARRELPAHMERLAQLGIDTIDLVAVNLYPFKEAIAGDDTTLEEAIENIDIGGPAMLRSAAKNYGDVIVLVDPADYAGILRELDAGGPSRAFRLKLAAKVFRHVAHYDSMIASHLSGLCGETLTEKMNITLEKVQDLRYGENPHQRAALYRYPLSYPLGGYVQIQGKELSFNNLTDAGAAMELLREFTSDTALVALKHANPCGVGLADTTLGAWKKAYGCDRVSVFGGIVATNGTVDGTLAGELKNIFLEIIMAPAFTSEALEILSAKKNIRILEIDPVFKSNGYDFKSIPGGMVIQDRDKALLGEGLRTVTAKKPDEREMEDMLFAWKVVKHVKSNAIVLAREGQTLGIGPGQTSRIWALENAIRQSNYDLSGAVLASDGFFPFPDCVEAAAKAGIKAIIQPGGSIKDEDSIEAADRLGLSMVFTGMRHFKH
jgi:phosphoribosylaminoimidazolecarboxamide formyltransferase/IMP cyclohydrolase